MKKTILLGALYALSAWASEPASFICCDTGVDTSAEAQQTIQMQTPWYMRTVHDLYANNEMKPGYETVLKNEPTQKTFMGFTAPVRDEDMQLYLKYQKEGDLPQLEQEYNKLKHEADQMSTLSFERFKKERRRSFIGKILDSGLIQILHRVRTDSLQEAQNIVYGLEHPPAAQVEYSQEQLKQRELLKAQARYLLQQRPDYKQMVRQQSLASTTIPSKEPEPTIPAIYSADASLDSSTSYDLKLTTPTDSDFLSKYVTADPRIDFAAYMQQIGSTLEVLKQKGLYTAETAGLLTKGFATGAAKHCQHIAQHPDEYVKDVAQSQLNLAAQIGRFFIDVYSVPEELLSNEIQMRQYEEVAAQRAQEVMELYNHIRAAVPQMSREQWGELLGQFSVDYAVFHGASKITASGIRAAKQIKLPTSIKQNPFLSKLHSSIEQTIAQHPEMLTVEGMTFKVPQAVEETSILKSTSDRLSSGSRQAVKGVARVESIANMKQVFEMNDFGRVLERNTVKTKFQCRKTGAPVYKVTEKLPEYGLKKGDQLCLDTLHFDHIEVYNKRDDVSTVLNLDGSVNRVKETKALKQARVLHKK